MANFSAAFGYDFYIVPLLAANVDVSTVGDGASAFVDDTSPITGPQSVVYTGGTTPSLTVGGSAYDLDGTGMGIRLAGLTQASLETDTNAEDVYTYDNETKGFNQAVATTKGFTISLAGVADFSDAGYQRSCGQKSPMVLHRSLKVFTSNVLPSTVSSLLRAAYNR